jgi:hypothetical protein
LFESGNHSLLNFRIIVSEERQDLYGYRACRRFGCGRLRRFGGRYLGRLFGGRIRSRRRGGSRPGASAYQEAHSQQDNKDKEGRARVHLLDLLIVGWKWVPATSRRVRSFIY